MAQIKSEKAKTRIQECEMMSRDMWVKGADGCITSANACIAIELAEQDARERAVRAFAQSCDCKYKTKSGSCRLNATEIDCEYLSGCKLKELFLKHYENEK